MHIGNANRSIQDNRVVLKFAICAFAIFVTMALAFDSKISNNSVSSNQALNGGGMHASDLTGTLTVSADKLWYKNNSQVVLSGVLAVDGSDEGYTIAIEIYFLAESTPRMTFYPITTATGSYTQTFAHPKGNEGTFTVWVNVLGHTNPRNSTSYKYDEHVPIVGTRTALSAYMETNPVLVWTASSDNNVTTANITYTIYRATKNVGQAAIASDYVAINSSVKAFTWTQTGALTSNKDYWYIISARDLAGNAANYTSTYTTYDTSKPVITSIVSPTVGGVYANTLNVSARITDSISFTTWARLSNTTGYNSSLGNLAFVSGDLYTIIVNITTVYPGVYNVTVYANDALNHQRISTPVQFTITKQAPIFSDIKDNKPDYLTQGNVTVRIRDILIYDVSKAYLYYSIDNFATSPNIVSMTLKNGTSHDGYYTALIPRYYYYLYGSSGARTRVYYKIWANNTGLGNTNISSVYYYDVEDRTKPSFTAHVRSPSVVQFYRTAAVTINATEVVNASGVDLSIAYLEYRVNGSFIANLTMANRGGNKYNALFQSFYDEQKVPVYSFGSNISYRVWARDQRGNWNSSQMYWYIVTDIEAPTIVNQGLLTSPVNYNVTNRIYANFTDVYTNASTLSAGINEAAGIYINYSIGSVPFNYVTMTKAYGTLYSSSWRFDLPSNPSYNTLVRYKFVIRDRNGNVLTSSEFSYTVVDQYAPTYSGLTVTPAIPTYRSVVNISLVVSDWSTSASGINYARIQYVNASGTQGWFMMTNISTTFRYVFPNKQNYGQTISFTIEIYDKATNKRTVTGTPFFIADTTAPTRTVVLNDGDSLIQYYERINVTVTSQDTTIGDATPSGIKNATFAYRVNGGALNRTLMTLKTGNQYSGTWNIYLGLYSWNYNITYTIYMYDNAGNMNASVLYTVNIKDNRVPNYYSVTVVGYPVEYDERSNFTVRLVEPSSPVNASGIGVVQLSYRLNTTSGGFTDTPCTRYSGTIYDGYWFATLPYYGYGTTIQYRFLIQDRASNANNTSQFLFSIDDLKLPTINSVSHGATPMYNQTAIVTVNATEPSTPALASGVQTVYLNYSVDGIGNTRIYLSRTVGTRFNGIWTAIIPAQDYNKIVRYNVTVIDVKGNKRVSSVYQYTVGDIYKPIIGLPSAIDTNNLDGVIEYFENFEVTVLVTEVSAPTKSSGTSMVIINYTTTGSTWNQRSMTIKSGGTFSGTWNYTFAETEIAWNQLFNYSIRATDVAGNLRVSSFYSFRVDDKQKPTISNLKLENPSGRYNVQANITVRLTEPTDAAGIQNTTIQYSLTGGVSWINLTSSRANGTIYSGVWSVLLPYVNYGITVQVRCLTYDRQGNSRLATAITYFVDDFVNPTVNLVTYDTDCEYRETNIITINITEAMTPALASGVANVYVNYSVNNGANTRLILVRLTGTVYNGLWNCTIPKQNYGSVIRFNYTIQDIELNQLLAPVAYTYTVQDHVLPVYSNLVLDDNNNHDTLIQYYELAVVRINVDEVASPTTSSGIISVTINRSNDGIIWNVSPMLVQSGATPYSRVYNFTFSGRDWNVTVRYKINILDVAGNAQVTPINTFLIRDNVAPTLAAPVIENVPVGYYENAIIVVGLIEPSSPTRAAGIGSVSINYSAGAGWSSRSMSLKNGTIYSGFWSYSLPRFTYGTVIQYRIYSFDRAGNQKLSATLNFTVTDDLAPSVGVPVTNGTYLYYRPVIINVTVTEPVNSSGVTSVLLRYSINGVLQALKTMTRVSGNAFTGVYSTSILASDYGKIVIYNFTATDVVGNSVSNVQTSSYTPGDNRNPNIVDIYLNDDNDDIIEYDENAEILADLTEETVPAKSAGVQIVILQYSINNWVSYTNITMTQKIGIDKWAGTWNAFVPTLAWGTNVRFYVHVYDAAGNKATSAESMFVVSDIQQVIMGVPSVEGEPITYNKKINITINLQEAVNASGVLLATLNYSYYGTTWNTAAMGLISGTNFNGNWRANLNLYFSYGTTFKYTIIARDNANNIRISIQYSLIVNDTTTPAINSVIQTDNGNGLAPVEYWERAIVRINITEAILPNRSSGIASVQLYYDVNGTGNPSNLTGWNSPAALYRESYTVLNYREIWYGEIHRKNYLAVIRYYIIVTDNAENVITSGYYTYTVQDLTAPVFGTISHSSVNYNESVAFTAVVNEVTTPANSSGVNTVRLETSTNGGASWVNRVMIRTSGTKFAGTYSVSVPSLNYGTNVTYRVRAFDFAGNNGTSTQSSYTVTDSFKPTFSTFTYSASTNYNQTQVIDVRIVEATNASGVDPVKVTLYWQNTTSTYSTSMIVLSGSSPYLNNTWRASLAPTSRYGQVISYWVIVYDVAGNVITSTTRTYTIIDSYKVTLVGVPVVTSTNAPTATVEYDENAIIRLNATEPTLASGISIVRLRWKNSTTGFQPNVTMTLVSGNQYQGIIPLQKYGNVIDWHVILIDVAGNVYNYSSGAPFAIGDLKAPLFVSYSTVPTIVAQGVPTTIKAIFNEPSFGAGLNTTSGSAKIHYNITGGTPEYNLMSMSWNSTSGTFDFQIRGTSISETVTFYLDVFDKAGNKVTTTTYSYIANDVDAPVISTVSYTSPVQYYAQLNITISATDIGTGVNQVSIYYRVTTSGPPTVISASLVSGTVNNGNWRVTLPRIAYGSSLNFYARAVDGVGYSTINNNGGSNYTCSIADNLIPSIADIKVNGVALASADVQYFQSATVTARLYKSLYPTLSSNINSVILNYTKTGSWNQLAMSRISGDGHDGVWSVVIPSPTVFNTKMNFTIHATDQASNKLNTAASTIVIKDHQNPAASNLAVVGSRYLDRLNVTIRIQKNSTNAATISTVTLSYRINSVLFTKAMNLISGTITDGVWNASIGPYNYATTVEISVNCLDQAGNALTSAATNPLITIGDNIIPNINIPSISPSTVHYYDTVNVTVRITEVQLPTQSSGINSPSVVLRYSINNWGTYSTIAMTVIGTFNKFNSTFTAIIPEQNYGITVAYSIHVRDDANNNAFRNGTSYLVGDNVAPTVVNYARTKIDVYYTETVTIRADFTEATTPRNGAGIKNATLYYKVDSTTYSVPMVWYSGGSIYSCTYEGVIPAQAYGKTVINWVTCYDNAGNLGLPGFNKSYVVDDNVAPTYDTAIRITDTNNKDGYIEYNETASILIHAFEPLTGSSVKLAILNWSVNIVVWNTVQRDAPLNLTRFDGWWNWTIPARAYGTNIRFTIILRDYEDNQVVTSLQNYIVTDRRAPVIGIPTASTPVYYTANGTITVSVQERSNAIVTYDSSGVAQVMMNYSANYGMRFTRVATRTSGGAWDGLYQVILPVFSWNSTIRYNVTAYDIAGRRSWSANYQFTINDTTAPTLSQPYVIGRPIEYYENASITVLITEAPSVYNTSAAGVKEVRLYYSIDTVLQPYLVMTLVGTIYSGNWTTTLAQFDYGRIFTGYVWAEDRDRAGTPSVTSNFTITFYDDKVPQLDEVKRNATVVNYFNDVLVTCRARDGISDLKLSSGIDALTGVEIHWRIGTNPYTTAYMSRVNGTSWSGYYSFKIPKQPYGRSIDYYIYVEDIANNYINGSLSSYVVTDTVVPVMGSASDNNPQYNAVPTFSIVVSEPSDAAGVFQVTLNYRVNNGAVQTRNANLTSGNAFNGTWQASTGMFNYNENITYNFTVSDASPLHNAATSTTRFFIVRDLVQPVLSVPVVNSPVTYNIHPSIQLQVEDQYSAQITLPAGINMSRVTINYTATGWGTRQVRSMSLSSGSIYNAIWTITMPEFFMWNSLVSFEIVAVDNAGNSKSITGSFTIFDFDTPQISSVQALDPNIDGTYEYNETITIRAMVTEAPTLNTSSGIDFASVFLYYRLGTSGPFSSKLMSRLTGAQYSSTWSSTINPRPYGTVVQYFVGAADIAGNVFNSTQSSYTVGDVHTPTYNNVLLSGAAPGAQPIYYYTVPVFSLIAIEDADASGVSSVQLNRTVNGTANAVIPLTRVSGDSYSGTWQYTGVPRNFGSSVNYFYVIIDVAGQRRTTSMYSYAVLDNVKPVLSSAAVSGSPVEYNEQPTISVQATEDLLPAHSSALKEAKITYHYNGSSLVTASMLAGAGSIFNRTYSFQVPYSLAYSWTFNFTINVTDNAGNWQTTTGSYLVRDLTQSVINTLALLDNNNEDGNYEYKESISVRLDASEAVNASGINQVLLNYSLNSGLPTSVAMSRTSGTKFSGIWTRTIGQLPYNTILRYNVTIIDYAGNRRASTTTTVAIKDFDKAQFSLPKANNATTITYLDVVYFQVNVTKPVNSATIQAVNFTYTINGGSNVVVPATRYRVYMAGYFEAWQYILPRQNAFTNITFFFTAKDVAGNVNSSITRPRQVVDNTKPLLTNILLNGQLNNLTWFVSYSSTLNVTVMLCETDGVSNGAGMDIVYLYYRSLGTEINFTRVAMTRVVGTIYNGTWYYLVPAMQWSGTVYLKVEARDRTFLESNYLLVNYNVDQIDSTPSVISTVTVLTYDTYPGYYDINEPASFYMASIYANLTTLVNSSGLNPAKIFVQFRPTNETNWRNATLTHVTGDQYMGSVYGMKWHQNITYRIYAENRDGFISTSAQNLYYARDKKAPVRVTDTIGEIWQETEVYVSIRLYEPVNASGVNDSKVRVYFRCVSPSGPVLSKVLSNDGTGKYEGYIDQYAALSLVEYFFYFEDIRNNSARYPATSNYTYLIGDHLLPVYQETKTAANAPAMVQYTSAFNFSIYCYDNDSSIASITLSYQVGSGAEIYLHSFVKVPGAGGNKLEDKYMFLIPGQSWADTTIRIYPVNITDSSGNTLDLLASAARFYITIVDPVRPSLLNNTINVIDAYQTRFLDRGITINFTATEPSGASGLKNISLIYTNSTGHMRTITSMYPLGSTFSFVINGQRYFTNITYWFVISDRANNILNTQSSSRVFKVDYYEIRNNNQTFTTNLVDPLLLNPVCSFGINMTVNASIRITEYDYNPKPIGPRYSDFAILGDVYKIMFNRSSAYFSSGFIVFNYSQSYIDGRAIDESTLVLARYTPFGYEELGVFSLHQNNNTLVIDNLYQLQSMFLQANQYTEHLVILGKYLVPIPSLVSPVLSAGILLYGRVTFSVQTQTFAQNVSAYYRIGLGGSPVLIGVNTSSGTMFTFYWNTTTLGNVDDIIFRFVARNAQGFSGIYENNSFFVRVHNIPDSEVATLTLQPGSIYSGMVLLSATSPIPASSAVFYYTIVGNSTVHIIGSNTTKPVWNGIYQFVGTCTFTLNWNSTASGDLNDVLFGFNLTSYSIPTQKGQTIASITKIIHNIPNPVVSSNIVDGEYIYGHKYITATTTYRGVSAMFYIKYSTTTLVIGTNSTSIDGGYTFTFDWDTSPIPEITAIIRLYVNITNPAGLKGSGTLEGVVFYIRNVPVIHEGLGDLQGQQLTGIITLSVIVAREPLPTQALFRGVIDPFNTKVPLMIGTATAANRADYFDTGDGIWYYIFTYAWDTRYLRDYQIQLNVTVTNTIGYNRTDSITAFVQLHNIPTPTITSVGSYTSAGVFLKTLNETVIINVTSPVIYAAWVEFYMIYQNGTHLRITGVIQSPDGDNNTFLFYWKTWLHRDQALIQIECRMYNLGGWSNLNSSTPAPETTPTFNIKNLPQPNGVSPSYWPTAGANWFGNKTIQATSVFNASLAVFYYHNGSGDFEMNGVGMGRVPAPAGAKSFTIIWRTDLIPEMSNIYIYVVMTSMGGFTNQSVNSPLFSLRNVPQVDFASIDQVQPGIIFGQTVQIRVASPNLGVNATLYCILDAEPIKIGFQVVTFSGSDYVATFIWDSLAFSKVVLLATPGRYDFDVNLRVDMTNAAGRNGTMTSISYHVYNAPAVTTDLPSLPARIANDIVINVTNTRLYVTISTANVSFYNGTQQVYLTMSAGPGGRYYVSYNFSSYLINTTMAFTFKLVTMTNIVFLQTYSPYTINNTPVANFIENFNIPAFPTVISGVTTFTANSSVQFSSAEFVVLVGAAPYPLGTFTTVTRVGSTHQWQISIVFDSIAFTQANLLGSDVSNVRIRVSLMNYRGAISEDITLVYSIFNAPGVNITSPLTSSTITGNMTVFARNTRSYITETQAYLVMWNGINFDTMVMAPNGSGWWEATWDSSWISDNSSYIIRVIMTSSTGLNGTDTNTVTLSNGLDFMTFLRAGVVYNFDLMGFARLAMRGSILVQEDAYLRIRNVTMPAASLPARYYLFDDVRVFNFTVLNRLGITNITKNMNVTFRYDYMAFVYYPSLHGIALNESAITLMHFNGVEWSPRLSTVDIAGKLLTVRGITDFSIFAITARQVDEIETPDYMMIVILISAIGVVIGTALIATRPKKEKEQIVPGKKKTCKQCGKYVKPYAFTCPYCGYKLAEEETMADAMNKLSHLFIFHEESGVCLYYHPFTDAKIDPQLISGFLSAITSFGGQFDDATKKKGATAAGAAAKKSSDLKELVYKEYRILMETSGPCKFAVLITGQTSKILSFKISQFIKHFMRTYDEALKDWKGNVRIFKDVEKMVRLIFGLTKVQPEGARPLPGKPPADEGAAPATGPKAPPPGYSGGVPPQKPVKPGAPAPMKPSLPASAAPQAAPRVQQAQPGQPSSAASSLFALKEQIGAPGEFTPSVSKEPEKPSPLQPKMAPELDKKDKKKDKKKGNK